MRKFSYRDLQKCAEREVALRNRVYAKHSGGQMTDKQLIEVAMMKEIAELLKGLADAQPERDTNRTTSSGAA